MTEAPDIYPQPHSRRHRRPRRKGPIFPTLWFCLVGISWMALIIIGLWLFRPHPLNETDWIMAGVGGLLAFFYFWVAIAVYRRRRYIFDVALACAALGLLSLPFGTLFSILLLLSLSDRKQDFTK